MSTVPSGLGGVPTQGNHFGVLDGGLHVVGELQLPDA
jgi:hypothetical protein